jgi:ADP-ribose pyrophosphatase
MIPANRKLIYPGRLVNLGMETAQLPDGRAFELEVVRHPGGAAVAALDQENQLCLLRQYRHAAGGWIWELPAGKLEPGEPPLHTAQRELEEEAGLIAQDWHSLGEILTTPGFCDEVIYLFLARGLTHTASHAEANECLEVHWLPLAQAMEWCMNGTIRDAKSLVGLFRAQAELQP